MKNLDNITLETDRLILRKVKIEDAADMYNNWCKDENVSKYLPWDTHKNIEATKAVINMWIEEYKEDFSYEWIVVLKENSEPIGTIGLYKKHISDESAEIGYVYGTKYWGKGYASEALKKVLDFLLNQVGFACIEAFHLSVNPGSGKVMEKAGMKKDATLKSCRIDKTTGQRCDSVHYYILKDEIIER